MSLILSMYYTRTGNRNDTFAIIVSPVSSNKETKDLATDSNSKEVPGHYICWYWPASCERCLSQHFWQWWTAFTPNVWVKFRQLHPQHHWYSYTFKSENFITRNSQPVTQTWRMPQYFPNRWKITRMIRKDDTIRYLKSTTCPKNNASWALFTHAAQHPRNNALFAEHWSLPVQGSKQRDLMNMLQVIQKTVLPGGEYCQIVLDREALI